MVSYDSILHVCTSYTPRWRFISSIQNCDHMMKTLYREYNSRQCMIAEGALECTTESGKLFHKKSYGSISCMLYPLPVMSCIGIVIEVTARLTNFLGKHFVKVSDLQRIRAGMLKVLHYFPHADTTDTKRVSFQGCVCRQVEI